MTHPIDAVLIDGSKVSKAVFGDYIKQRAPLALSLAADIRASALAGTDVVWAQDKKSFYAYDAADTTSADDGDTVILDATAPTARRYKKKVIGLVDPVTLPGVSHVTIPAGGNAQRPLLPAPADLRYNTDAAAFEGYNGSAWVRFADSAAAAQPVYTNFKTKYGAIGDGVADDAAALAAMIADVNAQNVGPVFVPNGVYRIMSPPPMVTAPIHLRGVSHSSTEFVRDYNAATGSALLHLSGNCNGSLLEDFAIRAEAGTSGGAAMILASTASVALSFVSLSRLVLSTRGSDSFANTLVCDGSLKTTAPAGLRDLSLFNVSVFGATSHSVDLVSVIGLDWSGAGVFPAGGTAAASGAIRIRGSGSVPSSQHNIKLTTCGGLNLNDVTQAQIGIATIGDVGGVAIANSGGTDRVGVTGEPFGTVQGNWTSSGIRRPGAAWSAT